MRADAKCAKVTFILFAKKSQTVGGVLLTEECFSLNLTSFISTSLSFYLIILNLLNLISFEFMLNRTFGAFKAINNFLEIHNVHNIINFAHQTGTNLFWLVHLASYSTFYTNHMITIQNQWTISRCVLLLAFRAKLILSFILINIIRIGLTMSFV